MMPMRCFLLLLTIAGCAAPQASVDRSSLAAVVGNRVVAGPSQRCVPILSRLNALQALDSRTLFYRSGNTVWINHLPDDCPRLRPTSNLAVSIVGSRYCRGDAVRVFDPGSNTPVTICALGDFTPYR
jgi:hypothetical protein